MSSHPQLQPAAQHRGSSTSRAASSQPEVVRIGLLGGFRVWVGSRIIEEDQLRLRKARSLIKLLALSSGHRLHREHVMELLWPGLEPKAAANNLHQILHAARHALEPSAQASTSATASSGYLVFRDEQLILCPDSALWVDVEAFEEAAAARHAPLEPQAIRAATELYSGELLTEDRYEPWVEERRAQLKELYLSLLLELGALYEEHEEYESAIEALGRVVAQEPIHEGAYVELMRLYALSGKRREALSQYERLREGLFREFGTEPEAASTRLQQEIWAGTFPRFYSDSSPASVMPEGKAPTAAGPAGALRRLNNLPLARTSFVGRGREKLEVKRLLAMTRLLTLTGTGGCGKTRLGLEVARDLLGAYPDGVWLVQLAPLSEAALVPKAVAEALEVPERPQEPLAETLSEVLRARQSLLILDNCEHLLEAVARLVDSMLDSCPRLRILATSREALGVEGELRWLVPPLSVPDPQGTPASEELEAYESVRLFVERAMERAPSFSLSPPNARTVADICSRLEGIPLAIELAAVRVGTLSVEQISERLDGSLKLLRRGGRTTVPRHQTLKGTLDWSYELLSEDEKKLFGRLSVFVVGWTLEAAETVGSAQGVEEGEVLELLSGLVDKSLVMARGGDQGDVRYKMLEPVRQYAWEKLEESGETQAAKRAHAGYFLALAEEAEPPLSGQDDAVWLDRLEQEHDNLRAALSWSLEHDEVELALKLGGALKWFWFSRGHYGEGRRWLEQALAREDRASAAARAKGLDAAALVAQEQGDWERSAAAAEEGLRLSDQAGLGNAAVAVHKYHLGWVASHRGDHDLAAEFFEESLELYREAGHKQGIVSSLSGLAYIAQGRGDHELAKRLYEECLTLSRRHGGTRLLGAYLANLGYEYLLEGDLGRATALSQEAVDVFRKQGHRGGLQYALDNLGWMMLLQGEYDKARALHEESLVLCLDLGDKYIASESLEGLACSASAGGEAERVARLFGAAEALREAVRYQQLPIERALREPYLQAARSRLAEAAWEKAFIEGRAMEMGEAIEYAFSKVDKIDPPTTPEPEEPSVGQPPVALTHREEEVARLVGRGLTNRQIAQELSISDRTVENHIGKILKKQGFSSRSQIAAWVAHR